MASASIWDDPRTASSRIIHAIEASFPRSLHSSFSECDLENDEEALKWAALEQLPTYKRLTTAILKSVAENGDILLNHVDVTKLSYEDRRQLIEKLLQVTEEDNEQLLLKLRDRIDKVGIEVPKIEVRFQHLTVDASVYVGSRALPTLLNFSLNLLEGFLTFLHLWPSRKRTLNILQDISGIIKPSRMTLLLGPPSSGKTTLLLALAGKLDRDLKCSGRVTYNGHELTEFVPQRTSAYISQRDLQMGEMTVSETLDFYGRCQGVGTRFDMLLELAKREQAAGIKPDPDIDLFMKAISAQNQKTSIITDYVIKILNLDICADIMVGDEMFRGISGGQKKRVTTGEMLVGPARALFMDEISTGLDSSTTFQIVKCLRQAVHVMDGTMLISLLQPAPETFELFDDIILLSEGQIVYQGPRESVVEFFGTMGFKCPERKAVADFLQEVTSRKDQEQYWADKNQPYQYIPVKEFAEAFTSFRVGSQIAAELSVPFDRSTSHPAALTTEKYGLSKKELFKACLQREWLLMKRNSFVYVFKICQISVIAVVTMSVFWRSRMDHKTVSGGNIYLGALFFGLINVMFNGFIELALTILRLPVLYKQRDLLLYPAWAFTLPTWILRLPLSFIDTTIWILLTYYTVGFAPEANRFFQQFLIFILSHQMALSLFRLIASVGRNMVLGSTFGSFILVIFFLLGGFLLSKDDIGKWWIWGYWISPMMYAQNAVSINEYLAQRWSHSINGTNPGGRTIGQIILHNQGLFSTESWMWISIGALVGFCIIYNILFTLALTYLNPIGKSQAVISEEALEMRHANRTGETSYLPKERRNLQPLSMPSSSSKSAEIGLQVRCSSFSSRRKSDSQDAVVAPQSRKGMILPFQPLSLAFDDINYYVDMPVEMKRQGEVQDKLQLLQNVCGAFKPGVLTALVGVSGAGKTTLMDVLAGRKTGGYITGSINISGYPKKQETFARISGYCEQIDIHSPFVTVYESLLFSAWLRLPKDVDPQTRAVFVEEVMELVELTSLRDAMVGLPGVDGLSTEQRKRLTIAVELVANPSIIFMDEPTSGLDARAAAIVMRTVRNTVDTGRTVVCTIHQPSIDIFEAFDELLLMKRGGQVIYAGNLGRNSHHLVEYFEAIPGVPKIKEGYNPATWMLDISSQGSETRLCVDFAEIYKNSTLYQHNKALIKELSMPAPGSMDLHFPTKYSQTFLTQFNACLWKQNWSYWRNPLYNAIKYYFTLVASLLFGSVYWKLGSRVSSQQDLFNIMGAMYACTLFVGVNNTTTIQPIIGVERTVFYRERAAGMYSAIPYALSQLLIEVPYNFMQTLLFAVILYPMISFQWTAIKFLWYFFFTFCSLHYFTYFGMMLVALSPNAPVASIIVAALISLWNLFSGFLIPEPRLPIWWKWFYRASPVAWTLNGLIVSQFGDLTHTYFESPLEGESTSSSIAGFVREYFGFRHDLLGFVAGIHVAAILLFATAYVFGIKHFNFQKR